MLIGHGLVLNVSLNIPLEKKIIAICIQVANFHAPKPSFTRSNLNNSFEPTFVVIRAAIHTRSVQLSRTFYHENTRI